MRVTFKAEGFRELERALAEELPRATAQAVLRRTAIKAMQAVEDRAKANAPVDDGTLRDSITTKTAKAKRRRGSARFERSAGVEVATGPAPVGALRAVARFQEEGTVHIAPRGYMRDAALSQGQRAIDTVRDLLAAEIEKAKKRIANKAAKAGRG